VELIEDGGKVVQETRLFDPDRGETRSMRSKEDAQDYRYFPDPDLLPLTIGADWIEQVRRAMPELPPLRRTRYEGLGIPVYDAALLTESREKSDYFETAEQALGATGLAVSLAHWINGNVSSVLADTGTDFAAPSVPAADVGRIVSLVHEGVISGKVGKDVLRFVADGEGSPDAIVERRGLRQISDAGALEAAVDGVLAAQAKLVADYRAGKDKAFNALVGQVMKATGGQANPAQAGAILRRKLDAG